MYYLNDKHEKYQYCLFCKQGGGAPYTINTYDDLQQVFNTISHLEARHNQYHHNFYIDNDFYENKMPLYENSFYYKFLRRPVADWEEFTLN